MNLKWLKYLLLNGLVLT